VGLQVLPCSIPPGFENPDYVVVGSGIVGLASAYHLARSCNDCRIVVVEKHRGPGFGDTGRSAAAFRAVFSSKLNVVLALSSVEYYLAVQQGGFDLGLKTIGYLFMLPEDSVEKFERATDWLRNFGVESRWYDASVLHENLGLALRLDEEAELMGLPSVSKGVLFQPAGILRPEKLVEYYYHAALDEGVVFLFGCEVQRLIVEARPSLGLRGEPLPWQDARVAGVELVSGEELRPRELVILATGAEAYRLLEPIGLDPHFRPRKQRVYAVRASSPALQALLKAEGFNSYNIAPFILLPKGVYVRPVPEENSFWTGGSTKLGHPIAWEPEPQPEPWIYEYGVAPVLRSYLPAFREATSPDAAWAGFYDTSIDSRPVVDTVADGLILAGGTSGSGIMKADAVGRAVSALALGMDKASLYGGRVVELWELGLRQRRLEVEELVI
jgi:glycine/D-amino acid oxidase-like deaminating enzyme